MIITCQDICKKWVAKLQGTNVFTPGSKNFKSSAIADKCIKQTYSLLTARKKISLYKNSLEILAKRCDFIFNPEVVWSVASDGKFYHLPLENTEYFQRIACLPMWNPSLFLPWRFICLYKLWYYCFVLTFARVNGSWEQIKRRNIKRQSRRPLIQSFPHQKRLHHRQLQHHRLNQEDNGKTEEKVL